MFKIANAQDIRPRGLYFRMIQLESEKQCYSTAYAIRQIYCTAVTDIHYHQLVFRLVLSGQR